MSRFTTKLLTVGLISASIAQVALADTLSGVVTDGSGDTPLQGAILTLEGIDRSATTDRFGGYTFNNIPAGEYNLRVSYVGAAPVTKSVVVSGDSLLAVAVGDSAISSRDSVLVTGSLAAQAGAINQQRASNAIISVIDSDGLGNFPDTTVADSLQRMTGISIENDQGEGRYVSIRGINSDLIGSTINGVRTLSPEDRRGVLLDGVPSDLLDTIEVQKSLTPDVDADTLGGVINLKTISAFDRGGQFIRAKIEGAYNEITEEVSPKATFTYSNVFADRLGIAFSVNYQKLGIESHNNETGGWSYDDENFNVFSVDDDYEMRWYDLTRERLGLVLNLDFQASDDTELYVRTLYNRYIDDEVRNKFEIRGLEPDTLVNANGNVLSYAEGEVDAEVRQREEIRNIQTYSAGGETRKGNWKFNYEASYAFAQEDDSSNHDVAFRSDLDEDEDENGAITFDYSDPQKPVIGGSLYNAANLLDPSQYFMDAFEQEFTDNQDEEWAGKFDVSYDSFVGSTPVTWKGGIKLRDREKVRDQNLMIWEDDSLQLSDFVKPNAQITNWRMNNPMFRWPDADLTRALRGTFAADALNTDDSDLESIAGDYTIQEQILAGYGMGTFEFGDLTLVAGVRVEKTDVSSVGNIFAEGGDPDNVQTRTYSDDYTHVLPSVNVRYSFAPDVIGRAAYYASIVRPGFGEMAPTVAFNDDQDEIELGNPALDPYEADNFDLALEFYPTKLSVISAGLFYKEIDNAIVPITYEDVIDDGLPAGVDLSFLAADVVAGIDEISTYTNVGLSSVQGVEFNYVQELGFIGPAFDGFLASANVTFSTSESQLDDGRRIPMLKQVGKVWNAAIGYDKGPWDIRLSANYRDKYLDEVFGLNVDRYTGEHLVIEASAKFDVSDNFQLYVEGKNLTDEPEYYYHGDKRRLSQYDEFGTTVIFGGRVTY